MTQTKNGGTVLISKETDAVEEAYVPRVEEGTWTNGCKS